MGGDSKNDKGGEGKLLQRQRRLSAKSKFLGLLMRKRISFSSLWREFIGEVLLYSRGDVTCRYQWVVIMECVGDVRGRTQFVIPFEAIRGCYVYMEWTLKGVFTLGGILFRDSQVLRYIVRVRVENG